MSQQAGLSQILRRIQWRMAVVALVVVGLILTLVSLIYLRSSLSHGLELVSRSVAYSAEAAVLFRDAGASQALLKEIVQREGLAEARIVLADEALLAAQQAPPPAHWGQAWSLRWLSLAASSPIEVDGVRLAEVRVRDGGGLVLGLLAWSVAGIAVGMALTALGVWYYSRKLDRLIVAPLREFAALTRRVREEGSLASRLPPASVQELDQLAKDFNTLLAAVQAHEDELLRHQADLRSRNESLSFQTRHDPLTGVHSRAYFEDRLTESVGKARQRGSRLGLLFVDADRFKQVNDQHGHDVGDRVLCELADRLRAGVRETDLVARLGGDEFVVLIEPLRAADDMQRVQHQLLKSVERGRVQLPSGGELALQISIGGATFPEDAGTADEIKELLRVADASMYANKQARRRAHAAQDLDRPTTTP